MKIFNKNSYFDFTKIFLLIYLFLFFFNINLKANSNSKKEYLDGEIILKFKPYTSISSTNKKSLSTEIDEDTFLNKYKGKYSIEKFKKNFESDINTKSASISKRKRRKNISDAAVKEAEENLNRIYRLNFSNNFDAKEVAEDMAKDPDIEWAEPNYIYYKSEIIPNDAYFQPPNSNNYSQWHISGINGNGNMTRHIDLKRAWDYSSGNSDIIIAVIDDGVDTTHPDIQENIYGGKNFGNDGSDDYNPSYFLPPNQTTRHYHGTHVAGIIAAKGNNGFGIAGISWNSKIMVLKTTLKGSDTGLINVEKAIRYAADNGADIVNMSFGAPQNSYIEAAVNYAYARGVVMVAAAGNEDKESIDYPAASSKAISVASTDTNDRKSAFSNYGTLIDISAPGSNILSLIPQNNYAYKSGTSMASPVVAGVIALMLSENSALTFDEIKAILKSTADIIDSENPNYVGKLGTGRINAYKALSYITAYNPLLKYLYNNSGQEDISIQNSSTTFSANWKFSETAIKYYYEITNNPALTSFINPTETTLTSISVDISLENNTMYYIYVQAENSEGYRSQIYRSKGVLVKSNSGDYDKSENIEYNNGVIINIEAGTFEYNYKIIVDEKKSTESIIKKANNNLKDSEFKDFANKNGQFFEFKAINLATNEEIKNFNKEVTIKIPYKKIIENGNVKLNQLSIYYLNETNFEWEKLQKFKYDTTLQTINFLTNHFSVYAILMQENINKLDNITIYPNPIKMKEQKKITFANLPSQAQIDGIKINIYDISGKKLKTLDGDDIDYGNKIYWDGRSDKNQRLASGIYIARIECSGSAKNEKIAIL